MRNEGQMTQFREALEDCDVSDLGFIRFKYTWNNGRQDGSFTKERLDRAVDNNGWRALYKKVEVKVLAERTSDHKPLLIEMAEEEMGFSQNKHGSKFEAKWLQEE